MCSKLRKVQPEQSLRARLSGRPARENLRRKRKPGATLQNTLQSAATFTGLGLHGGTEVRMVVKPAGADHGIVFLRTDLNERIPARWDAVVPSRLCTLVANANGASVSG